MLSVGEKLNMDATAEMSQKINSLGLKGLIRENLMDILSRKRFYEAYLRTSAGRSKIEYISALYGRVAPKELNSILESISISIRTGRDREYIYALSSVIVSFAHP